MQGLRNIPHRLLISSLLALLVLAVFGQVASHSFVNFDDPKYIYENPHVRAGVTKEGLAWAFTTTDQANWHPLTWLSHMADVELFGLSPGGHHLVNAFLHLLNAVLLFLVLSRMTGKTWQSGFAAALFAVHPLHVESVAWAAERKDVLSAFFWMLALWAYAGYAERRSPAKYVLVASFFLLGLLSKPMVVTLPFVLLLLDYWPLERKKRFLPLLAEKAPLFLFSIGSCVATYIAQQRGGAIPPADLFPFGARAANAVVSYFRYMGKTVWPASLTVFYPHPWRTVDSIPVLAVAGAFLGLSALTVLSIRWARRRPYLMVGWFWYLGTLVPAIGLVQVGGQAMADRYTYLPLIGLFIAIAWGIPDLLKGWRPSPHLLGAMGGLVLLALAASAWVQASHWKNSVTLFGHAVRVSPSNALAHYYLGNAFAGDGRTEEAVSHYRKALKVNPYYFEARYNLANALESSGRIEEAIANYNEVLRLRPGIAEVHNNLGISLAKAGRLDEAISHFREALRLDPGNADVIRNLGIASGEKERVLTP
jgi:tetratricopeptide (TPR) repeat protein